MSARIRLYNRLGIWRRWSWQTTESRKKLSSKSVSSFESKQHVFDIESPVMFLSDGEALNFARTTLVGLSGVMWQYPVRRHGGIRQRTFTDIVKDIVRSQLHLAPDEHMAPCSDHHAFCLSAARASGCGVRQSAGPRVLPARSCPVQ